MNRHRKVPGPGHGGMACPGALGALAEKGLQRSQLLVRAVGGLQLGNPRFSEGQGELLLSFDCRFVPTTAGNDEYAITIT